MNLFEMQSMETEKDEIDGEIGNYGGGGGSRLSVLLCDSTASVLLCL